MSRSAAVIIVLSFAGAAHARRCVTTGSLPGHTAVTEAHFARNWSEMDKAFKKFCDDNKKTISCEVIPSDKSHAEEKMKALAKSRPCAEILNATEATPPVLYMIDEPNGKSVKEKFRLRD